MGALTPVFLFLLFLSAHSDESSKLDSSCFSSIPISNSVTALYVFGDSTVDAGNNNYVHKAARANSLPYGIDFNNTPTGRFTNGKTIADFIAILYNLSLPPPYLSLKEAQRKTAMNGINYASAGCGIFPNTKPTGVKYLQLFLLLVNSLNLIRGVHHGFRFDNLNRLLCRVLRCLRKLRVVWHDHAIQLSTSQTLKNIQDEYPDATLTLANSRDLLQDILADTEKYGFTDVKDPRCGTYVNGELACIPNSTPCDNRCQYLFFDASHTSEFANCIFVRDMLIKD
ncbi:GDSL esterase/lipase 5-like [Camellia sinensis]|uniref:GDSL esterase/lipase 5-like n=1 Tax=Camellia sinensis TaxID=4442 RepID=UPI001036C4E9|nr:GDSL esterase/lipase 5-like [Camellia sinensis]